MKLKVKDMDIATGGALVAILNEEDAHKLDLYHGDRIVIKKKNKTTTAVVDIAESENAVPIGKIGLFEEVLDALKAVNNDIIEMDLQEKPRSVFAIKKKLEGGRLTNEEIDCIVKDVVENKLTDIELSYFIGSCYSKDLNLEETVALTKSIVKNGSQLKFNKKIVMDKHCSGGVPGNRTTMIVVPILAAAGLTIPKTSSRSITSPAGTADTMEVLAPVSLSLSKIKQVVKKTNGCIVWGGAVDLAAADDKLIRLRHSLSLDPESMLLSSILAKKAAVNATHVLIDVPLGKDTKVKTMKHALHLKRQFIKVGKRLGIDVRVIITDGRQPIGNGSGPALEARDALYILKRDRRRPLDLEEKSVMMATKMMEIAGIDNARIKAQAILDSGLAYQKMKEIIKAQGGNPDIEPEDIKIGKHSYDFNAPKTGRILDIDNFTINKIARIAGAPRDKGAGIFLYKRERQLVKKGERIFTIYADNEVKMKYALKMLRRIDGIKIK